MKKVLNFLLVILVLLGMTGCSEGPIESIEGANNLRIDRRNITKKSEWIKEYMDCWDFQGKKIFDPFVNPGDKYEYKLTYNHIFDGKSASLPVVKTYTITANESGLGELAFESKPKANYDENTGILTFDKPFTFSEEKKAALKPFGTVYEWATVRYKSEADYYAIVEKAEQEIRLADKIYKDTNFNVPLTLRSIDGYISVNRISYNVYLKGEDFPAIKTITVKKPVQTETINK